MADAPPPVPSKPAARKRDTTASLVAGSSVVGPLLFASIGFLARALGTQCRRMAPRFAGNTCAQRGAWRGTRCEPRKGAMRRC